MQVMRILECEKVLMKNTRVFHRTHTRDAATFQGGTGNQGGQAIGILCLYFSSLACVLSPFPHPFICFLYLLIPVGTIQPPRERLNLAFTPNPNSQESGLFSNLDMVLNIALKQGYLG